MSAYGVGPIFFNLIFMSLCNPDDLESDKNRIFPKEVADNVPRTMKIMSCIFLFFGLVAFFSYIPKSKNRVILESIEKEEK